MYYISILSQPCTLWADDKLTGCALRFRFALIVWVATSVRWHRVNRFLLRDITRNGLISAEASVSELKIMFLLSTNGIFDLSTHRRWNGCESGKKKPYHQIPHRQYLHGIQILRTVAKRTTHSTQILTRAITKLALRHSTYLVTIKSLQNVKITSEPRIVH